MKRTLLLLLITCTISAVHVYAGEPASAGKDGVRHWAPFKPIGIQYDYVDALFRNGKKEVFLACNHPQKKNTTILLRQYKTKKGLEKAAIVFSSKEIKDIPDLKDPKKVAPYIQMSRLTVKYFEGFGYVCMIMAFPGEYGAGKHPLVPALLSSKTGNPGTWTYHGRLKGEPRAIEDKRKVWCDGGGIVRLPDGTWRIYINGYGPTLAAIDSKTLGGEWTFVKDEAGKIRNIAPMLPVKEEMRGGAVFPYVLQVSDKEYHCWMSDQWPVHTIWHMVSTDGLNFKLYGKQPEIDRNASNGQNMKGIRAHLSKDGSKIIGWIPFNTNDWQIHQSSMPVGVDAKE